MDIMNISVPTAQSLEDIAQALAEGEHDLGAEATRAGYALIMWPGQDCPWFVPGPTPVTAADDFRWRWNHGTAPGDRVCDLDFNDLPF